MNECELNCKVDEVLSVCGSREWFGESVCAHLVTADVLQIEAMFGSVILQKMVFIVNLFSLFRTDHPAVHLDCRFVADV